MLKSCSNDAIDGARADCRRSSSRSQRPQLAAAPRCNSVAAGNLADASGRTVAILSVIASRGS
jgi:hypothetical protein